MNKELKQKIKNEIKEIIEDINYEEYRFNQVFHSDVIFHKSFYKFAKIYKEYGKEAYLKYVPHKYQKQELNSLILDENFLDIYEHYGLKTLKNLEYTANLANKEMNSNGIFAKFFIKLKKLLSKKFINLPTKTILALPEGVSNIVENETDDGTSADINNEDRNNNKTTNDLTTENNTNSW